jgi:hypothetical protein
MDKRQRILHRLAIILPLMVFSVLLYTFLHESGHALFGVLFGGRLTSFDINFLTISAHAGISGEFSTTQRAVIAAAGVSLPLVLWALMPVVLPPRRNPLVEWFTILFSVGVVNSLLAFIIIPVLHLFGRAPGDDATNFLRITGFPPLLVTLAALLIYTGAWILFFKRLGGWRNLLVFIKEDQFIDLKITGQRKTVIVFLGMAVLILAASLGLDAAIGKAGRFAIPAGYALARELNLAQRGYTSEVVFRISLDAPEEYRFFITIENIDQGPLRIELAGTGGYHELFFLMGSDNRIGQAIVHPQGTLAPGDYGLVVTVPQNRSGKIGIFVSRLH